MINNCTFKRKVDVSQTRVVLSMWGWKQRLSFLLHRLLCCMFVNSVTCWCIHGVALSFYRTATQTSVAMYVNIPWELDLGALFILCKAPLPDGTTWGPASCCFYSHVHHLVTCPVLDVIKLSTGPTSEAPGVCVGTMNCLICLRVSFLFYDAFHHVCLLE